MKVGTSTEIGALVRERRGRLALTQGELAQRVGVSRLWVAQLEKGKLTAQVGLVLRTLRELGVEMELTERQGGAFGGVYLGEVWENCCFFEGICYTCYTTF